MTIRTRLTLWYSGMLLASLFLMLGVLYYELVYEPRSEQTRDHREQTSKKMADILFMYGAPTVPLLLVGGWFLMRRTLKPIATLTETTRRITADNLRERLLGSGNGDEIDQLSNVLNEMLGRLESAFRSIQTFTLNASHELKSPLTILRGEIEMVARDPQCPAAHQETLAGMLDEIQRLARIVDDLSLLTRANAGELQLSLEPINLCELAKEAWEDARILAEPNQIEVRLASERDVTVTGDRHRLRQVLLNLIGNAVKYNQPQGSVHIRLQRDRNEACLVLSNTGPGIPPDQIAQVQQPFFRGPEGKRQDPDGCGLGLSIVHWIVKLHGGTLLLESEPGQETRILIRLPLIARPSSGESFIVSPQPARPG